MNQTAEGPAPLARITGWITRGCVYFGMGWVLVMMFLTTFDVAGRYFFSSPIPGTIEISEILLAVFGILGLGYTQREGANVRVTMLVNVMKGKKRILIDILSHLLCILVIALLSYQSWVMGIEEFEAGTTTDTLGFPHYPIYFLLSFGSFSLVLEMVAQFIGSAKDLIRGS